MKKTTPRILIWLGGIALVAAGIVLAGFWRSLTLPLPEQASSLTFAPGEKIDLGATVTGTAEYELPISFRPGAATVTPPEGMVLSGQVESKFTAYRWSRARWQITFALAAVRPGDTKGGALTLPLQGGSAGLKPLTQPLPVFVIAPLPSAEGDIQLAKALYPTPPGSARWPLYLAIAFVALLVLWIIYRIRLGAVKEAPLPPWARTRNELGELKNEVRSRRIGLEHAFTRLTDLVRNYLEERYRMPASTRTTDEFMTELRDGENPLPDTEKPFLSDFLAAADLIKFARVAPEERQFMQALEGAEELVIHTTPQETASPEAGKGGKHV